MNINLIIIFILQDLLGDYFLVHSHTILSRLIYPFIFYASLLISPTVLTSHPCFSSLPIYLFRAYYWWWLAGSNWGNICRFQDSSVGCFSTSHCHSRRNIYHWWSVPWTVIYFKIVSIFSHDGSNFCVQHSLSQTIIQNQWLSSFTISLYIYNLHIPSDLFTPMCILLQLSEKHSREEHSLSSRGSKGK